MFHTRRPGNALVRSAGLSYFPIAFIARLPFAMMTVGVLTLVVAARGSVTLGGLTSAAAGLGTAVAGPLLGAAVDRLGQRRVLVPVGLVNAALLGAFPFVVTSAAPDLALLALSVLIGTTAPQISPMSRTRLVGIVRRAVAPDRREQVLNGTMAYESTADETVFIIGPFLVGLLATALAPELALEVAAVLALVFVTWFAVHPTARLQPAAAGARTVQAPARELVRFPLLTVVAGTLGVGFFFGSTLTSLTGFLALDGDGDRAGLLYGVMGIGSAALALGTAVFPARFTLPARWLAFGTLLLAGAVLLASARSVPALVVALVVLGCGVGPTLVTLYGLGARLSPAGRSATTMTMLGSATVVGQAVSSAVTGLVTDSLGAHTALLLPAGAAVLVVAAGVAHALAVHRPVAVPQVAVPAH